jgi:hypothetical protein
MKVTGRRANNQPEAVRASVVFDKTPCCPERVCFVYQGKFAMAARTTSQKPRGTSFQKTQEVLSRETSSAQP